MRITKIPKKRKGHFRTIYMPDKEEKASLQKLLTPIHNIAMLVCPDGVCHGFWRGRSIVTNAMRHVGFRYTLSFDLEDFFDTVTREHVETVLPDDILDQVIVDGAARQGLPTSPSVANVAARKLDAELLGRSDVVPSRTVYTRYADDMTFSSNLWADLQWIKRVMPGIVESHGFRLNKRKTHLQDAKYGRRRVTGIAVGEDQIYPPRKAKRKLRAAKFRGKPSRRAGMEEFVKVKLPTPICPICGLGYELPITHALAKHQLTIDKKESLLASETFSADQLLYREWAAQQMVLV